MSKLSCSWRVILTTSVPPLQSQGWPRLPTFCFSTSVSIACHQTAKIASRPGSPDGSHHGPSARLVHKELRPSESWSTNSTLPHLFLHPSRPTRPGASVDLLTFEPATLPSD